MAADSPATHARSGLDLGPELVQGFENLRAHKLRSLLTMLGMIFGVAAVIAMLSIGAGAQQQVIAFIEQLGVNNVIVESREAADDQALQKVRKLSAGLSFEDYRSIQANVQGRPNVCAARGRATSASAVTASFDIDFMGFLSGNVAGKFAILRKNAPLG